MTKKNNFNISDDDIIQTLETLLTSNLSDVSEQSTSTSYESEDECKDEMDIYISIRGKHHIVDGFLSEIYGISHYSVNERDFYRSPLFIPTILSPSLSCADDSCCDAPKVGSNPYDYFGFEPYFSYESENIFQNDGFFENYDVTMDGFAILPHSPEEPLTIAYAPEVNSILQIHPDGSVVFSYGYSDPTSFCFTKNRPFIVYSGPDTPCKTGDFSDPFPLFLHTTAISVHKLSDFSSSSLCDCQTPESFPGYRISVSYTLRSPNGVYEEADVEFEIKAEKSQKSTQTI